ncbi:MAG TPA: T9SS type A sorting domain-containing protein [Ignavibacteriaceae bacterium]|nr:T9SS type A sorting domain-containing protein [Ignavibacteriaceae bacterium]
MKKIILFSFLISFNFLVMPQSYFPQQAGYKWYYKNVSLDSINNPSTDLIYYQIDSFAVVDSFQGKLSNYILSKAGPANLLADLPYIDTSYVSIEGNKGYIYNNALLPDTLLNLLDTTFIALGRKFDRWYNIFSFDAAINQNVTVFTWDTTVTIDTITMPLRFDLRSKRLADLNVITDAGTFPCKAFFISRRVSYLLGIPPFVLPIPIAEFTDSIYISENRWVVKQVSPTTKLDLSILNFGVFYVPGNLKQLVPEIMIIIFTEPAPVNDYYLGQNYPNPFNPSTKIDFSIPEDGNTKLIVYNIQGEEVMTIVNSFMKKGKYQISFGNNNLPSGAYLYCLTSGNYSVSRKMILLK